MSNLTKLCWKSSKRLNSSSYAVSHSTWIQKSISSPYCFFFFFFYLLFICCVIWVSNLGLWTRPVRILCDQARDQYWGLIYLRVVPRPQICVKVFIFKNPEGLKLSSSPLCQWGFCLVPVTLGPLALFWSQLLPWFRSTSPSKSNCTSAPACLISLRD